MRALTKEWVDKAEGDFHTASREARARKVPNYDAVCFHCQQCAEKYLKAYLQEQGQRFPPVHDLIELLELCLPYDETFELQRDLLKDLTRCTRWSFVTQASWQPEMMHGQHSRR
jgi:HEPN domain-containing protein